MVRLKVGSKLGHMVTWPLTFEFSDVEVGHGSLELSPDQRPLQQRLTGGIDGRRGDDEVEGQQAHHGPPIPHRAGGPSIVQTVTRTVVQTVTRTVTAFAHALSLAGAACLQSGDNR